MPLLLNMWIGSQIRFTARQPYASPPGYQSPVSGDNVPNLGSQDTTGAQPHHGSTPPSPCHNNDNLVNSTPCLLLPCTHWEDPNASPVSQFLMQLSVNFWTWMSFSSSSDCPVSLQRDPLSLLSLEKPYDMQTCRTQTWSGGYWKGSLTVQCPACLYPGQNLPENLKQAGLLMCVGLFLFLTLHILMVFTQVPLYLVYLSWCQLHAEEKGVRVRGHWVDAWEGSFAEETAYQNFIVNYVNQPEVSTFYFHLTHMDWSIE